MKADNANVDKHMFSAVYTIFNFDEPIFPTILVLPSWVTEYQRKDSMGTAKGTNILVSAKVISSVSFRVIIKSSILEHQSLREEVSEEINNYENREVNSPKLVRLQISPSITSSSPLSTSICNLLPEFIMSAFSVSSTSEESHNVPHITDCRQLVSHNTTSLVLGGKKRTCSPPASE